MIMPDVVGELTTREKEVALGIADGLTYSEIADRIGLKLETVRSYVSRLRDKTEFRRKPQLALWAHSRREDLTAAIGYDKSSSLSKGAR